MAQAGSTAPDWNHLMDVTKQRHDGSESTVSVIVPVHNNAGTIRRCLAALVAQSYPASLTEIIVVDDGSTDGLGEVVAEFPCKLVAQDNRGSYAARNHGVASSRGSILAFTDSDCIPDRDWITRGVSTLAGNAGAGLVAGAVDTFARDPQRPTAVETYDLVKAFPQQRYAQEYHFGATANVFTRRSVFEAVGGFDERLRSGGDGEWGRRVHAGGFGVVYAADVIVRHPARASWGELYAKMRRVNRASAQVRAVEGRPRRRADALRAALRQAVPPMGSARRDLRSAELSGLSNRAKYVLALFLVRYLSSWLLLRYHVLATSRDLTWGTTPESLLEDEDLLLQQPDSTIDPLSA